MTRTVGGTMVSRILGLSRWGGPLSAYFELTGEPDTTPRNTAMGRGLALEESVLAMWAERDGWNLWTGGMQVTAENMPYAHATLDATAIRDDGSDEWVFTIPDAKTLAREEMSPEWGPDGSDRIVVEYHLQLLWYLGVCKAAGMNVADEALLPTLCGPECELQWAAKLAQTLGRPLGLADIEGSGLELRVYRVAWDAELFAAVNERVLSFLREHVEPRTPPQPGPGDLLSERDLRAVARGLRAEAGKVVDFITLPEHEQAQVLELLEATRQRKEWEALEEQARARAQLLMGGVEEVHGLPGGARVLWKTIKSGTRRFEVKEPRR